MTATTERTAVVTPDEYNAIFAPPVKLKTPAEMFESQAQKWMSLGLLTTNEADGLRPHIPDSLNFLLVPENLLQADWDELKRQIVLDGKSGENDIDPQYVTDLVNVPPGAYLLLDIEDGRTRLNTKPSKAAEQIKAEGRRGFTVVQGLAFGIVFPDVLRHHNLDLVDSRYRLVSIPTLYLDDGVPRLGSYWGGFAFPKWGAPSAGSVVGTGS